MKENKIYGEISKKLVQKKDAKLKTCLLVSSLLLTTRSLLRGVSFLLQISYGLNPSGVLGPVHVSFIFCSFHVHIYFIFDLYDASLHMKKLGGLGEKIAAEYLIRHGYKILARNYAIQGGEIDIVAQIGRVVVFIEVKTRTSNDFGSEGEQINHQKRISMMRSIKRFLAKVFPYREPDWRVDLIEISLEHFRDIEL